MPKPLRLLALSLKQFAIGFGPGILLAFVCLAIQALLWSVAGPVAGFFFEPEPEVAFDVDEWIANLLDNIERRDWRKDLRELAGYTLGVSIFFFFHVLVAVILTSWLLRRHAGFERLRVLRRALRGAAILTAGSAVVFAAAYVLDDVFAPTRYIRFDFTAAGTIAVWFGGTALLLPARVMGHRPVAASGLLRNTLIAAVALVPWFYASEWIGAPLRHCRDCAGILDGGLIFYAVLGLYFLGLTVSSAAVSSAACMPLQTHPSGRPAAL